MATAIDWLTWSWAFEVYRRDRTEGQQCQGWVLYEKATLSAQVETWTADYGIPTAALRGHSSESRSVTFSARSARPHRGPWSARLPVGGAMCPAAGRKKLVVLM
jgi:hypothetical protein